jgi:cell division protein FtsL
MKLSTGEKIIITLATITLLLRVYDIFVLKEKLYEKV